MKDKQMEESIVLTKSQTRVLLSHLKKAIQIVKNLELYNPNIYFTCCENTEPLYTNPEEFGRFIKELEERLNEES